MRFLKSKTVLALLASLVPACKMRTQHSASDVAASSSSTAQPHIVLIAAGGWNSCFGNGVPKGSRIYDSFKNLVQNLTDNGAKVNYLISCLQLRAPNLPNAPMVAEDTVGHTFTGRVQHEYFEMVQSFLQSQQADRVYFIGHSYGGWMALNLIEKGVKADAVFTLDPVDARDCRMADGIGEQLGFQHPECQRNPNMTYDSILTNTKRVFNLWQPQGGFHSSPIQTTIANRVVNYKTDVKHSTFGNDAAKKEEYAHRMIGSYPESWGIICNKIFKASGMNSERCTTIDTDGDGHRTREVTVAIPDIGGDLPFSGANPINTDPIQVPDQGNQAHSIANITSIGCDKQGTNPDGSAYQWEIHIAPMSSGKGVISATRNGQSMYAPAGSPQAVTMALGTGERQPAQYLSTGADGVHRNKLTLSNIDLVSGHATGLFESIGLNPARTVPEMQCTVHWGNVAVAAGMHN